MQDEQCAPAFEQFNAGETGARIGQLFDRLRRLMADAGPNRHDSLIAVYTVAIEHGIDTAARLIGTAVKLGFNRQHAGLLLGRETGPDPKRHRWFRQPEGGYRNHPDHNLKLVEDIAATL